MLLRDFMDTLMVEIFAGVMIFAAANMAYFEIRRLIQFLRAGFDKSGKNKPGDPSGDELEPN
jgi:hypothetical protein